MLPRVMLLVVLLGLSACRPAGGFPPPSPDETPSESVLVGDGRCFSPEVALEYAGRSTTAELGVQEAEGDPMSTVPADIYITRDRFQEGIHFGRLVCAVYDGGFIEITVHPADHSSPPPPTPSPTPLPSGLIEILTHCGLSHARVQFAGQEWRFDVADDSNAPEGWGFNTTVVEIRSGPHGPIVTGPDGSEWQLVPADPDEPAQGCL